MTRRALLLSSLVVACLAIPDRAGAQFNHYWLPVERGFVDSQVLLQLHYSNRRLLRADQDVVTLAIEAQYTLVDRFEVGLSVPFVAHGWHDSGTRFGDIKLSSKAKLFGLAETFALSAYINLQLPTNTGDFGGDYFVLFPGLAASAKLKGFLLGGTFNTVCRIGGRQHAVFIGFDAYGGYEILGLVTLDMALQFHGSVHPDDSRTPVGLIPGIEVDLLDFIRIGAACRIALNDDGEIFYFGRASLLFHGGIKL
jgi:hypothetical protein